MPDPRHYPVLSATLVAPAVAYIGGRLGLDLDDEQATILAGAILAVGSVLATASTRSRRSLPDPDAVKDPKVVQAFEPTTYVHRPGVPDPLPTRPDPGRPERQRPRE